MICAFSRFKCHILTFSLEASLLLCLSSEEKKKEEKSDTIPDTLPCSRLAHSGLISNKARLTTEDTHMTTFMISDIYFISDPNNRSAAAMTKHNNCYGAINHYENKQL